MLERLMLLATNEFVRSRERRNGDDDALIFRANNPATREIMDAMLLDGELPSVINDFLLHPPAEYLKEHETEASAAEEKSLSFMADLMRLEGADPQTVEIEIAMAREEMNRYKRDSGSDKSVLRTVDPVMRVDLGWYDVPFIMKTERITDPSEYTPS